MRRLVRLLTPLLLATGIAAGAGAHEGHDDAPGTGGAAIPGRHVLTAASDRYEVVLKNDPLRPGLKTAMELYLSDFSTNAPITAATVSLSLRSDARELWTGSATATNRAGVFTVPFQAPADTGSFTMLVAVAGAGGQARFALSGLEVTREHGAIGGPLAVPQPEIRR